MIKTKEEFREVLTAMMVTMKPKDQTLIFDTIEEKKGFLKMLGYTTHLKNYPIDGGGGRLEDINHICYSGFDFTLITLETDVRNKLLDPKEKAWRTWKHLIFDNTWAVNEKKERAEFEKFWSENHF